MSDELLEPVEPPEDHDCTEVGNEGVRREITSEARGWGPGWPTDNSGKMSVVRAGGIALSVRRELAPVIDHLVRETVAQGYVLRHGECWGFANRPIRGTQRPSNHSWGLAVDLNARTNPMQASLRTDMPPPMIERWTSRLFRWGGEYRGRKDPMHFEFTGTPADAARLAAALGGQPTASGTPVLRRPASGSAVIRLQERLNAHGAGLNVDGAFGDATETAVRAFQTSKGLTVDGIVGPETWAALG